MDTSKKVLFILESNKDIYTSGEEMARQCGISRNAVWKAIKDLREKGYDIEAISNKGYKMTGKSDIISVEGIISYQNSSTCSWSHNLLCFWNSLVHASLYEEYRRSRTAYCPGMVCVSLHHSGSDKDGTCRCYRQKDRTCNKI